MKDWKDDLVPRQTLGCEDPNAYVAEKAALEKKIKDSKGKKIEWLDRNFWRVNK